MNDFIGFTSVTGNAVTNIPEDDRHGIPGIMPDHEIRMLANDPVRPMITPFHDGLVEAGVISYGLSSYGYDTRCAKEYMISKRTSPKHYFSTVLDPKALDATTFERVTGDTAVIPPHGFMLTRTVETFDVPDDVLCICLAKSTYARLGVIVGVTPLEPGWKGQVTIELSNTTPYPVRVYGGEGICQFLFLRGSSPCDVPYNRRGGKYMNQEGIVLPRIYQKPE